jgi:hypothetical protein
MELLSGKKRFYFEKHFAEMDYSSIFASSNRDGRDVHNKIERLKKAKVAQLVEHNLAKVGVASSNLVFRSQSCLGGGTGRHAGLKILFLLKECGFDSRPRYKGLSYDKPFCVYSYPITTSIQTSFATLRTSYIQYVTFIPLILGTIQYLYSYQHINL